MKLFSWFKKKDRSYHDVLVIVDGKEFAISDRYNLWLMCTRVSGWVLYNTQGTSNMKDWVEIGGEYCNNKQFEIWVKGVRIL